MKFSHKLLKWYHQNKRDLPWRDTKDPYIIWLSEIILQQTRVAQGLPYFYRFTAAFPHVEDLANASEDKLLKLWQGLGYYSRARNLHQAARQIQSEFKGKFPSSYDKLLTLNGVGEYTAAAVASFAFQLPHPVVDGNVFRFLSRHEGIDTPVNSSSAKKEFQQLAFSLMDKNDPAGFNQAIMEFGALQCIVSSPDCNNCVFNKTCVAFKNNLVKTLPVKTKKVKVRSRYFNYLFIMHQNGFYIRKRTERDIWQHLYELPMIETVNQTDPQLLFRKGEFITLAGGKPMVDGHAHQMMHQLTHQKIHASFYRVSIAKKLPDGLKRSYLRISEDEIPEYAFPRLIENYLNTVFKEN
jgi:A/G-specific adenine glycosylase